MRLRPDVEATREVLAALAEAVTGPSLDGAEVEAAEIATAEAEQDRDLAELLAALTGGADGTRTRGSQR